MKIARQNNVAVSMIEHGHYNEAATILKSLLVNIKTEMKIVELTNRVSPDTKDDTLHQLILQTAKNSNAEQQQEDAQYTYTQPVCIPLDILDITENAAAVVSSVVILNLALVLHMKGVETTDTAARNSRLRKALSLYRLVLDFNARCSVLRMIVLNNTGIVHSTMLNERERGEKCFAVLLAIWVQFPIQIASSCFAGMAFNAMMGRSELLSIPSAPAA
eukprot:scaffold618_cov130-Cylindrotheca_fusiformis.AAC.21